MVKRFSLFTLFMLAFILLLAACGGDDETSGEEGGDANASDDEQTLIYARGGDSTSLDFASTSDGESSRVTRNIFESLVTYDKDSFEIVPALAQNWDISEDGNIYTCYLEENVKFHD